MKSAHFVPSLSLVILAGASCGDDVGDPAAAYRYDSHLVVNDNGRITDLVCPGAKNCESADGPLMVGVARRKITPVVEPWVDVNGNEVWDEGEPYTDLNGNEQFDQVWMAGFGRGRAAIGVHDDLWLRALSISKGDTRLGLIVIDTVGIFVEEVLDIRQVALDKGLGFDHITMSSTHNHEAKDTMGMWGATVVTPGYDRPYMVDILKAAVGALAEAKLNERPTTVELVQPQAPHLVADSRQPKVVDPTLSALNFLDPRGVVFATMVMFGLHPESLDDTNRQITSDYPHYLRNRLEAHYPGSTTLFFAGTLGGLMNPYGIKGCPDAEGNATCPTGTFSKARYIGEGLADLVIDAFESRDTVVTAPDAPLGFRRKSFLLRTSNQFFAIGFGIGLVRRVVFDPEERPIPRERLQNISLEQAMEGAFKPQTEVNDLTIGPIDILTIPGELYPELWLAKEDGSSYLESPEGADYPDAELQTPLSLEMPERGRRKAIINQTNDALGYIIPKRQYDAKEPHAYRPDGQYGEENSIGEDTAPTINQAVRDMYTLPSD